MLAFSKRSKNGFLVVKHMLFGEWKNDLQPILSLYDKWVRKAEEKQREL